MNFSCLFLHHNFNTRFIIKSLPFYGLFNNRLWLLKSEKSFFITFHTFKQLYCEQFNIGFAHMNFPGPSGGQLRKSTSNCKLYIVLSVDNAFNNIL